jgi:hypothetical protein
MSKASSADRFKLINTFQALRKTILQKESSGDLEKPLAYWALPGDRRLPLAFLGRSLKDLMNVSFDDLAATPGIGQKKIGSLIRLLARAAKKPAPPGLLPDTDIDGEVRPIGGRKVAGSTAFNPEIVSESQWEQWRETVRRHGLSCEKIGRLAPTLQELPTGVWDLPLSEYLDYSVAEMRQLKTHGQKRVRGILEVFSSIHDILGNSKPASHLTLQLVPKFVVPLESWISQALYQPAQVSEASVRDSLAIPLLAQLKTDCGPILAKLVESRLGLSGNPQSVKIQSKKMGLTRARVYQLLEDCQSAMRLRWKNGRFFLTQLLLKMQSAGANSEAQRIVQAVVEVVFPDD